MIGAGAKGLLYPSIQHPGGTNLVVFNDALDAEDQLEVHDPGGDLPTDQSSWPRPG